MASEKYLYNACRAFGHTWSLVDASRSDLGSRVLCLQFLCTHCDSLRSQHISETTGAIYRRTYKLTAGYTFTDKKSKDRWRKDYLRELTSQTLPRNRHPSTSTASSRLRAVK